MTELLFNLLQTVIVAVVPTLTVFLVNLIKSKSAQAAAVAENEKAAGYILQIAEAVVTAVDYTSQTYVDNLKSDGFFNTPEQKVAISLALDTARASLTKSTLDFIETAYGDVTEYLVTRIEAEIRAQKG